MFVRKAERNSDRGLRVKLFDTAGEGRERQGPGLPGSGAEALVCADSTVLPADAEDKQEEKTLRVDSR